MFSLASITQARSSSEPRSHRPPVMLCGRCNVVMDAPRIDPDGAPGRKCPVCESWRGAGPARAEPLMTAA